MPRASLAGAVSLRSLAAGIIVSLGAIAPAAPAAAAIGTSGNVSDANTGEPYNGADDPWVTTYLTVGDSAPGSMTISGGSMVDNSSTGRIAFNADASTSSVTVTGNGSKWDNAGSLGVGIYGAGALVVTDGGSVSSGNVHVGFRGTGTLNITGGGSVVSGTGYLGAFAGSNGTATVGGGTGSSVWETPALVVGDYGAAELNIVDGGSVFSRVGGIIGRNSGGNGVATVGGSASAWTTLDVLVIGDEGSGILNITDGGSVSSSRGEIGQESGGSGTVTVGGGAGAATWTNVFGVTVGNGTGRTGVLNIEAGGLVIANALNGGSASSGVNFDGGTLRITSTDSASNSINLLSGGGTIDVSTVGTAFTITSSIGGAGGLTKTGGGTLVLTGANSYLGHTIVSNGTLRMSGSGSTGSFASSPTISLATGAKLDVSSASLSGGRFTLASGQTLQGTGLVVGNLGAAPGATLAPGASIGTLTVNGVTLAAGGSLAFAAGSTLAVEIDVDAMPDADLLDVNGSINLGGATLDLTLLNTPWTFASPATFVIVQNEASDPIMGTFADITGLPANWSAAIDYAYAGTDLLGRVGTGNDLAVTLNAPNPGVYLGADFNEDGFVDGNDLAAWQAEFGREMDATHAHGDANEDGGVNGTDVLIWQQQLGKSPILSTELAGTIVPELTSWALALFGLGGGFLRRRGLRRL
jgi:T5SS/PEP-CTERM-associated repeat protein/autotransporter-associated beta strand protein